jgi:hypothetical protein
MYVYICHSPLQSARSPNYPLSPLKYLLNYHFPFGDYAGGVGDGFHVF